MSQQKASEPKVTSVSFPSVEVALNALCSMLPVVVELMERDEEFPEGTAEHRMSAFVSGFVTAMLADPEKLRARLEKIKSPDGSVSFALSPERRDLLRREST